jgi:hypothetical protein
LEDLGYEAHDLEFWDAWLILEEASAETVIREILIPNFVPSLSGRLATVSAKGNSRVRPIFDDFTRVFLYAHLQPQLLNHAWVVVDGDAAGVEIVEKLRRDYGSEWDPEHFRTWSESQIENFYPEPFTAQVAALAGLSGVVLKDAKRDLLQEVVAWTSAAGDEALVEWRTSASEIINLLQSIADSIRL